MTIDLPWLAEQMAFLERQRDEARQTYHEAEGALKICRHQRDALLAAARADVTNRAVVAATVPDLNGEPTT